MKIDQITLRYNAKRTAEYQSAEVGAEMTLTMEQGDKICDVFRAGMAKLHPLVDAEADGSIRTLVADARAMKGI